MRKEGIDDWQTEVPEGYTTFDSPGFNKISYMVSTELAALANGLNQAPKDLIAYVFQPGTIPAKLLNATDAQIQQVVESKVGGIVQAQATQIISALNGLLAWAQS